MKNVKRLIKSMEAGQIAFIAEDNIFDWMPIMSETIIELCSKACKVLYVSLGTYNKDIIDMLKNEGCLKSKNLTMLSLDEAEFDKSNLSNLGQAIINNCLNEKYDYIFVHDTYDAQGSDDPNIKRLIENVWTAEQTLKIPVVCCVEISDFKENEDINSRINKLYYSLSDIADIVVLAEHLPHNSNIKIMTLDLRIKMTEEEYDDYGEERRIFRLPVRTIKYIKENNLFDQVKTNCLYEIKEEI